MAKNIFPLFGANRVLKKEYLWALRDYSYGAMKLEYAQHSEGIISGFAIEIVEQGIKINRGIIKYRDNILLLPGYEIIPYEHTEQYVSLKLCLSQTEQADYILFDARFILEPELALAENEFEIARFKLKNGSVLRNAYTAFYDIQTEYDTVNLLNSTWSGIAGTTLNPVITTAFANEAMRIGLANSHDFTFCSLCLNSTRTISRTVIIQYIRARLELKQQNFTNEEIFKYLMAILANLGSGGIGNVSQRKNSRREIFFS